MHLLSLYTALYVHRLDLLMQTRMETNIHHPRTETPQIENMGLQGRRDKYNSHIQLNMPGKMSIRVSGLCLHTAKDQN